MKRICVKKLNECLAKETSIFFQRLHSIVSQQLHRQNSESCLSHNRSKRKLQEHYTAKTTSLYKQRYLQQDLQIFNIRETLYTS